MKKIAVFVHSMASEYATTVVSGIYDYFKDKKDVTLFIIQTRSPHYQYGISEYQYWAGAEYAVSDDIDGIIIVSNTYNFIMTIDEIRSVFKKYKNKKIVSIGLDLKIPGSYYTTANPDSVYDEIVDYLKNKKGRTNIGFMSGNPTGSLESLARYEAYKKALKKHGLEYKEENVFHAFFTMNSASEIFLDKCRTKKDVHFDSIICANDMMACGIMEALQSLGFRIPEDIMIVGFDNTSHSCLTSPTLSTVDQVIKKQGEIAAKMMNDILRNKKVNQVVETPLKVIYRRSTDSEVNLTEQILDNRNLQPEYYNDLSRINTLQDLIRGNITTKEFIDSFIHLMDCSGYDSVYCSILDYPLPNLREDNFTIPDHAKLLFYVDPGNKISEYYENGLIIKPKKQLFPKNTIPAGIYMFQPLYLIDLQYGYLCCKVRTPNFAANSITLKLLDTTIIQNYEFTKTMKLQHFLEEANEKLLENNSSLDIQSKTDELTTLLNRRGFFENGQKLINFSLSVKNTGIVCFGDLDNLKIINDTYGHDFGDLALKTQAQVFKAAFRQSDIFGRLSGDEFAVIANGMTLDNLDLVRNKINSLNAQYSKENKLPFTISISLGFVPFTSENSDLTKLLKQADQKLYEEKRIKHAKNNPQI